MLVTRTADNFLHNSFVVRDTSFGTFATLDVIVYRISMLDVPAFSANHFCLRQPSVGAISCVKKKRKKHYPFSSQT